MNVSVRQASIHDLDALVPLFDGYRQFYGQPSDPAGARRFLAARFGHQQSLILFAHAPAGAAIGFTQLYPLFSSVRMVRTYVLNDLFVRADARRGGVGAALLRAAAAHAGAMGAASLALSTAEDNTAAQALYESLGWRQASGFREYVLDLSADAA